MFLVQSLISLVGNFGNLVLKDEGSVAWTARLDKRVCQAQWAPRARRGCKAGLDRLGQGATKVFLDAQVPRAQGGQPDPTARRVPSVHYYSRLFITINTFIVILISLNTIRG